jgi:hypothetical protein
MHSEQHWETAKAAWQRGLRLSGASFSDIVQLRVLLLQFGHQFKCKTWLNDYVSELVLRIGGACMRMIAILAVLSVGLMPLGGCFFHHQQAVVAQPLRPLK